MKKLQIIILTFIISLNLGIGLVTEAVANNVPVAAKTTYSPPAKCYTKADPLDIVKNPTKYLNKRVRIVAQFDKFSTLGLDYKPAYKSSEDYITFLIKRSDVINNVVPLSELKNFLKRKVAEKYIDLEPGDMIEYKGIVFSDALSDAWLEVEEFTVLKSSAKKTDKK